jgi:ADP-heptose:LPS heptosyltransferase
MRFLISRLSSLGDVVCTLPAAVALKSSFPDSKVSWVVSARFSEVVRLCTAVDEVILAKKSLKSGDWPELAEPFVAAFDLQGLFKSAWPVHLSKSPVKLGYHWQREGSCLFTNAVLPDKSSFHIVDQYVDVVRSYGAEASIAKFGLLPRADDLQDVTARLKADGAERFIIINPGAGWAAKRWPPGSFAQVGNEMARRGRRVVLIGGATEEDQSISSDVASGMNPKPLSWTGKTTIGQLVALISIADAHVGGDTGSTHIAAALGVPAIGLYSLTNPRRSCPYRQIHRCLYQPNGLGEILASAVIERLEEALS